MYDVISVSLVSSETVVFLRLVLTQGSGMLRGAVSGWPCEMTVVVFQASSL